MKNLIKKSIYISSIIFMLSGLSACGGSPDTLPIETVDNYNGTTALNDAGRSCVQWYMDCSEACQLALCAESQTVIQRCIDICWTDYLYCDDSGKIKQPSSGF